MTKVFGEDFTGLLDLLSNAAGTKQMHKLKRRKMLAAAGEEFE